MSSALTKAAAAACSEDRSKSSAACIQLTIHAQRTQVYGTGSSSDLLHTAFNAIADHHFIPAVVDFYNSPTVRPASRSLGIHSLV